MDRDKAAKFVELANRRVNRVIRDLQLVSNLANRQNYEYTEEQAKKIIKVLQYEVELVKQSFTLSGDNGKSVFKL